MNGEVRYYPVGNGNCTLITTPSNHHILVDCRLMEDGPYDVRADLLDRLGERGSQPYLPVFVLTHGDQDHALGFEKTFQTGPPSTCNEPEDDEPPKIVIGTLWFSPYIFEDDELCDDAEAYRQEAERRLELYRSGDPAANKPGNRIVVIGYKSDENLEDLPNDIVKPAGETIDRVDDVLHPDFRVFIHAPFRSDLDDETSDRNHTSLAFMAAFGPTAAAVTEASTFFFGGDVHYIILEKILRQTRIHDNEPWLEYDVWLTPHHCSWTVFNEVPSADHPEPRNEVLELLAYKREQAKVIASSKPVKADADNPPHIKARNQYVDIVDHQDYFLCTMEEPTSDNPQPIVFEVTPNGPRLMRATATGAAATGIGRQQQSHPEYG